MSEAVLRNGGVRKSCLDINAHMRLEIVERMFTILCRTSNDDNGTIFKICDFFERTLRGFFYPGLQDDDSREGADTPDRESTA